MKVSAITSPFFDDDQVRADNAHLRFALVAAAAIILLLAFAVCVLIFRPRVLPYVVMVNEKGEPMTIARPVTGTQAMNTVIVKWALAEFIRNARTVTGNTEEQKEHLRAAYAFAREQAAKALSDYYHDGDGAHDPFQIAQKGWVEVRILRTLSLPAPDTYECDWTETAHQYSGAATATSIWRATLKAAFTPPDATDPRNAIGLYVTTLDWSAEAN
jgi:type IV secretory pathway TrbF-like protein